MTSIRKALNALTATAAFAVTTTWMAGTALAMDPPLQAPQQERARLSGNLVSDMQTVGTFDAATIAQVPGLIGSVSDGQAALLAQYFYLLRGKAETDAYLYSLQQQEMAGQFDAAQAQTAELQLQDQIAGCYSQIATMPETVQILAQYIYASVPGWCVTDGCFVPEWYYVNGCYVGPCRYAAWAGPWAAPVCNAWFDHGSHFYMAYHHVADKVRIGHSVQFAKLHGGVVHSGVVHSGIEHAGIVHAGKAVVHVEKVKPEVHTAAPVVHEVKTRVDHAPAPRVHAAKATAHVARPAAHVAHAKAAVHSVHAVHASSGGHGRR